MGPSYNLLALDGGGVKGVSSLLILQKIMDRVRDIENIASQQQGRSVDLQERKPVDYFDLAAGTSTGGISVLKLFRLEMTCSDALECYMQMAEALFSPMLGNIHLDRLGPLGSFFGRIWRATKVLAGYSQFPAEPFLAQIDATTSAFPLDQEDQEKKGDTALLKPGKGKVYVYSACQDWLSEMDAKRSHSFVCATLADLGESVLLRNYVSPPLCLLSQLGPKISISARSPSKKQLGPPQRHLRICHQPRSKV
jgi:hypothetical protein